MKNNTIFIWLIALLMFSVSCRLVAATQIPDSPGALFTQAAETLNAQLTFSSDQAALQRLTELALPISLTPTDWLIINTPSAPSATAVLTTATPFPTFPAVQPTATAVPGRCNHAYFVKDVTIPDGTEFYAGREFTKIWRLKNIGTCSWNKNYALIFSGGDYMGSPKTYPFKQVIEPGDTVDIAVDLIAPSKQGKFTSYWMLMNTSNQLFGVGSKADSTFWTSIKVSSLSSDWAEDFATNFCAATWTSSAGSLLCPGDSGSNKGSITFTKSPYFENERHENEPTLITRPEPIKNGWIKGVYPAYKVQDKDHFVADVGCLYGYKKCNLIFTLQYQVPGNQIKQLGVWQESYDGKLTHIDVDLSFLAGKSVQFILIVTNDAKNSEGYGFWFTPSIHKVLPLKTATPTATATSTATVTSTATATATATEVLTDTPTATATETEVPNP